MPYRPKHPLIVVVNADGSGYTLQFSTFAEAKTAYASIQTSGVAYLYSPAEKSLSLGDGYATVPEYDNGATYGTGALVSLNGTVYKLINFIGAGGYGPITHPSAWTTDVVLPRALPPISSTGLTDGARRGITFTNVENIGFPDPACPSAGTILEQAKTFVVNVSINETNYQIGTKTFNLIANGDCTTSEDSVVFDYVADGTQIATDETNNYISNGDGTYRAEPITPEEPQIIGYQGFEDFLTNQFFSAVYRTRVRPQYDNNTFGEWSEWSYTPSGTLYGSDDNYNYYSNGSDGYYSEAKPPVCHPYGTQLSSDSGTYYINVGCGDWSVGTWNSATYADGNCGTYSNGNSNYLSNGQYLGNCNDYNYYSNGSGGSYQGEYTGNPCTSYGTFIEGSSSDIYADNPCSNSWVVGQSTYSVYADGNCGTYSESGNSYKPYAEYLGECNGSYYYSDGNGGMYAGV